MLPFVLLGCIPSLLRSRFFAEIPEALGSYGTTLQTARFSACFSEAILVTFRRLATSEFTEPSNGFHPNCGRAVWPIMHNYPQPTREAKRD
jgi:hypothetical protein